MTKLIFHIYVTSFFCKGQKLTTFVPIRFHVILYNVVLIIFFRFFVAIIMSTCFVLNGNRKCLSF
jgi:hypothetical protein